MEKIYLGIDVGSTTTKVCAIDPDTEKILYFDYQRHHANQLQSVKDALCKLKEQLNAEMVCPVLTGSGAKPIARLLQANFVQEVVANSIALKRRYENVGTAIELGGQDAKIIFFHKNKEKNQLDVSDMRMNGSCAGGTGAFIDEVASILKTPIEEFNGLAEMGSCVYDISGRCGVYAKTDIQPLLNQGISRENLALSAFHAIAKQTIGGLAQGLDITTPVAFEGGPLTFNPQLIAVFAERLHLKPEEILIPDHPEIIIANGAALSSLDLFKDRCEFVSIDTLLGRLEGKKLAAEEISEEGQLYFTSEEEKETFLAHHKMAECETVIPPAGTVLRAYLGIDSGSTTTKFVLMGEDEQILDTFYAMNEGDPLLVAKNALIAMREKYRAAGVNLQIISVGTTGYGEMLFYKAFTTETHVVETVAHARAATRFVDNPTFILDIGGQDMKAIWLDHGIITNIVVNEACSSGCGSFLANFASTLDIPVKEIAGKAFEARHPAKLGSRCTVFMNSSIITEQRNGRLPEDIMAGLCRSIIENVFTKVIRISNVDSLGDRIVVQGGTFQNDAVLRALEQYLGKEVIRAPYAGIMGAIGAALTAKEQYEREPQSSFIGLDALDDFEYSQVSNLQCPFCTNHCKRTIVRFSTGGSWITNNRCERGEVLGDPKDAVVREQVKERTRIKDSVPNLYKVRKELMFKMYDAPQLLPKQNITIGLPRVLSYWETMPFWSTFWRSLGFDIKISPESTRAMYEDGLKAVTSDTVCFPAKLVHGHLRKLINMGVDRIFMPSITVMHSENTEKTSVSMCGIVKGYPIVIRNSDNPERIGDVKFDSPLFHWFCNEDRNRQLPIYMKDTYGIPEKATLQAIEAADRATKEYDQTLKAAGAAVLAEAEAKGTFAVVLASRPYQNDALVNHDLPDMFTGMGIPVLTADSLPEINHVRLKNLRIDVVNNYHARMLSSAVLAAESDNLEYVQLVSFGCGHDAYLSDEIIRLMKEISGKTPLILKVDESDVQGPLQIRVRSFVETVRMKRRMNLRTEIHELPDPYPQKFTKKTQQEKVVLIPNTSHAFSRIMAAALKCQNIRAEAMPIGREEAIRLGKKYVHNDICFPAQIVIGEALEALESGRYDNDKVAIGMAKYIGCCRLTHYGALLRKALDDAGYPNVEILTNDDVDYHELHPGFKMNLEASLRLAFGLPMIDAMEELLRKIRPYELVPGSADAAFEKGMQAIEDGLSRGIAAGAGGFKKAIGYMKEVEYDRSNRRPTVLIVGEYLLNFHPGANHEIEKYLEQNGFEIIEAKMTDVIQKTYFYQDSEIREYKVKKPLATKAWMRTADDFFDIAHALTNSIAKEHELFTPAMRMSELVKGSDQIFHHTYDSGEGVLIPAEIIHHAEHGCKAFVILQPFGCLPNHVVGRGITKRLKELYPDVQILPLDYDPDVSFANIENRLQMLIMNAQ